MIAQHAANEAGSLQSLCRRIRRTKWRACDDLRRFHGNARAASRNSRLRTFQRVVAIGQDQPR
ncbi:MAG TPA: hypothetical protein PKC18_11160, partial [Lacipirellulaceae bacterium]|nr:hypothetical protein [Lacipirellulaceae bacterium]